MTVYNYLKNILTNHNKTLYDIIWIGCKEFKIEKEFFYKHIKRYGFYDEENNECNLMLPYDLLIVGNDFWIEIETHELEDCVLSYKAVPIEPKRHEKLLLLSTSDIILENEKFDLNLRSDANLYHRINSSAPDNMKLLLDYTIHKNAKI